MIAKSNFLYLFFLLAAGSAGVVLTLGCLFGAGSVVGLMHLGNMYHQEATSLIPAQFSHLANKSVEKEIAFAFESWSKGSIPATHFQERPWLKAAWSYSGENKEILVYQADGLRKSDQVNPDQWLNVLGGLVGTDPRPLIASLQASPSFATFTAIIPAMPLRIEGKDWVLAGETTVGAGFFQARGVLLDRKQMLESRLLRLLETEIRDNYMAIELCPASGTALFTANNDGIFPGSLATDSLPANMECKSDSLRGFLDGFKLHVHYIPEFWGKTPSKRSAQIFMIAIALISSVAFSGLLFFFYQSRRKAQELELQNDWVLNLAHTLRGPVHSLGILTDSWEVATPDNRRAIQGMIRGELEAMDRANLRFIRLSRASRSRLELTPAPVELQPVVESVVARLLPRYPKFPAKALQWEVPGKLAVQADVEALREIVETAVENALKYSSEGKPVQIRVSESGKSVQVTITDQGVGIRPEDVSRIGEAFFRGTAAGTDGIVGTGLGIYLAQTLCKALNGSYQLTSDGPGKGATVKILLPKASA